MPPNQVPIIQVVKSNPSWADLGDGNNWESSNTWDSAIAWGGGTSLTNNDTPNITLQ